jgi:hypothetical protein
MNKSFGYSSITVNLPEPGIYSVADDSKALSSQSRQLRAQVSYCKKLN